MKNKILIFVTGLVAGVTIGVLFSVAIKELLIQFKELHISLNKIDLEQSHLSKRLDSIQGKLVPDKVNRQSSNVQNIHDRQAIAQQPAITKESPSDSGGDQIDESEEGAKQEGKTADSDIVVMTNELVSVSTVPLKIMDTVTVNKKTAKTDSALASMSDVDLVKEPTQYRVEFWKSPLNYKGYKMSRGKIILYGISPAATINLELTDGTYYLIVSQTAYMLEYTDDYKPFEKVSEKTTLKKLGL